MPSSQMNYLQKTNGEGGRFPNLQNSNGSGDKYTINRTSKPVSNALKANLRLNSLKMNVGGQEFSPSPLKGRQIKEYTGGDAPKDQQRYSSQLRNAN